MGFDRKKYTRKITGRDYIQHLHWWCDVPRDWRVPFLKPPLIHHDGRTSDYFFSH